jgi:hypothetical protein
MNYFWWHHWYIGTPPHSMKWVKEGIPNRGVSHWPHEIQIWHGSLCWP